MNHMEQERALVLEGRRAAKQDAIEQLSSEFDWQFEQRWHTAAQLVLLHRGRVVLERARGVGAFASVTTDTPFLVFSIAKSVLALCIHHLVDRRVIGLGDPVSRYWREFSGHGKAHCTIRHVLLHQTGLPTHGLWRQLQPFSTWNRSIERLERSRPSSEAGIVSAYQPLNYGFILGEVLQRVSGLSPQEYLEQHFLKPMGLTITTWAPSADQVETAPRIESRVPAVSTWLFNRKYLRTRLVPGFNLLSTANELAAFFLLLSQGGCYGGTRYLSVETVREATALHFRGSDLTVGRETLWAMGFHLGGFKKEHAWRPGPAMGVRSSVRTFGHCGHLSSIVWADPDASIVFAFTCNGLLSSCGAALRWQRLADLAWNAVAA
ncbi:MAG TPA: serine hydrolase domain-containing protein [Xanthobacteraceae bacterium]|nr:serine hydrolase domain-containing protein [Xanthobacteraceae bacterium]